MAEFQAELAQPPGQANSKRRLELLAQLSDTGEPAAAPVFAQALLIPELAREAAAALVKLGAAAYAPLQPLLFGAEVRPAALAALVLAEIGEPVRERLKDAIRALNYDLSSVAGAVKPRMEWPLAAESMAAARLERPYVEKQYRTGREEAFFRTRLDDVQALVSQIGAPLVALIAASQQDDETLRVAAARVLRELGWDDNSRAPAYLAAQEQVPKRAALLPRQKRRQAWVAAGLILFVVLCFCLPVVVGMLGG